jgi:hypothetical protein
MNFGVLFERVTDKDFPSGYFYAHVPSLGLTTHGLGIEGTRAAAADLVKLCSPGGNGIGECEVHRRGHQTRNARGAQSR